MFDIGSIEAATFETSLAAAFAYGFAGSLHCVAMCGPLTMIASTRKGRASLPIVSNVVANDGSRMHGLGQPRFAAIAAYQTARLCGYAALGAIFGAVGHGLDLSLGVTVSKLLPSVLVTLLLVQAFNLTPQIERWLPKSALKKLTKYRPKNELALATFIGGMTALIPCGFLYSTAPMAIAGGSASAGAALLAMFALGTAPALVATSWAAVLPLAKLQPLRRVLLVAAAAMIIGRLVWLSPTAQTQAATPICHSAH